MQNKNAWWLTLMSVGMIAYGVAAVWTQLAWRSWAFYDLARLLVPVLVAVVGAACLVKDAMRQPGDGAPRSLALSIEPYVLAWRRLWSTKWLLCVYGSVAAVSVLGSLASQIIGSVIHHRMWGPDMARSVAPIELTPLQQFTQFIVSLWYSVHHALAEFIPRFSTIRVTPVLFIVALLALIWVLPRLSRLAHEPDPPGDVRFFRACLVLLFCGCVAVAVLWFMDTRAYWVMANQAAAARAHPGSLAHPSGVFGGTRNQTNWYPRPVDVVIDTIVSAILIGGILGSLARSRKGQNDVKATFLGDAVRYFEPLAGIYVVLGLLVLLPMLLQAHWLRWLQWVWLPIPLLVYLLMYAPMGVVAQGPGFFAAVRHSLRVWRDNVWRTLSLIATGVFLSSFVMGPPQVINRSFLKADWARVAFGPVFTVVGIAVSALVMLAVWEFYSAQVLDRQESLQEQR